MRLENVDPDSTTYTFMINMYSRKGMHKEIIDTYDQMRSSSCVPDRNVCHIILTAHSKLGAHPSEIFLVLSGIQGIMEKFCLTIS